MELIRFFLPTHLLIPFIISLFLLILTLIIRKPFLKTKKWLFISVIVFLCVYIFIIGSAIYLSNYYQWELQKFDLDGNGLFSIDERSPEQQRALSKVAGDTARNFSLLTGLLLAFLIATLTYIVGLIIEFINRKKTQNINQ